MTKRKRLVARCLAIELVLPLAGCGGGDGGRDDSDDELPPGNWDSNTWDNFVWR